MNADRLVRVDDVLRRRLPQLLVVHLRDQQRLTRFQYLTPGGVFVHVARAADVSSQASDCVHVTHALLEGQMHRDWQQPAVGSQ